LLSPNTQQCSQLFKTKGMKELVEKYNAALYERFKTNAVVTALEKEIINRIEKDAHKQCSSIIRYLDGHKYEYLGAKVSLYSFSSDLESGELTLDVYYVLSSEGRRSRVRAAIKEIKDHFEAGGRHVHWTNHKPQLSNQLYYKLKIGEIVNGVNIEIPDVKKPNQFTHGNFGRPLAGCENYITGI
jgi:hypothetical protein